MLIEIYLIFNEGGQIKQDKIGISGHKRSFNGVQKAKTLGRSFFLLVSLPSSPVNNIDLIKYYWTKIFGFAFGWRMELTNLRPKFHIGRE